MMRLFHCTRDIAIPYFKNNTTKKIKFPGKKKRKLILQFDRKLLTNQIILAKEIYP